MALKERKYNQVILYLCQKLGGKVEGKKKLAKLLYFADFDFFEKTGVSITGDAYKALPMGPFPISLERITAKLKNDGALKITTVEQYNGYNPTEVYTAVREADASVLSPEEQKMLDRIAQKYGMLTGKQLEDLSHEEAPYVASELNEIIPYELAYYRGTDFSS